MTNKEKLTEATILSLQGKLIENKLNIVDIQNKFINIEKQTNFTKACIELKKMLNDIEIGQHIKFKVDNSYHNVYSDYEKISNDLYKYTYYSDKEVYWDTEYNLEQASEQLGNSFLTDELLTK